MSVKTPENQDHRPTEFISGGDLDRAVEEVYIGQEINSYINELDTSLSSWNLKPGKEFERVCQDIFQAYQYCDHFSDSGRQQAEKLVSLYGKLGCESPASAELLEIKRSQVLRMAKYVVQEKDADAQRITGNFVDLLAASIGCEIVAEGSKKSASKPDIERSPKADEDKTKSQKIVFEQPTLSVSADRITESPAPSWVDSSKRKLNVRTTVAAAAAGVALAGPLSGLFTSSASAAPVTPETVATAPYQASAEISASLQLEADQVEAVLSSGSVEALPKATPSPASSPESVLASASATTPSTPELEGSFEPNPSSAPTQAAATLSAESVTEIDEQEQAEPVSAETESVLSASGTESADQSSDSTPDEFTPDDVDRLADAPSTYGESLKAEIETYVKEELDLTPADDKSVAEAVSKAIDYYESQLHNKPVVDSSSYNKDITLAALAAEYPELQTSDDAVIKTLIEQVKNNEDAVTSEKIQVYKEFLETLQGSDQYSDEQKTLIAIAMVHAGAQFAAPEVTDAEQEADGQGDQQNSSHGNNGHKNGNHGHKSGHGSKHHGGGKHHNVEKLSSDQISHRAIEKMKQMGPMWHNRAVMLEVLLNNGWKPHQAAGAIGNACIEAAGCELNPHINQIGYDAPDEGMGIIQWTKNGRWQGLLGFARSQNLDPFSVFAQAKFIHFEMMHGENYAWDKMQGAGGPNEAAYVFGAYYERPADLSSSIGLRQQYARGTLDMYNNQMHKIRHDNQQELRKQRQQLRKERREQRQEERRYFQFDTGQQIKNHLMSKYDDVSGKLGPHELEKIGNTWGHSKLYPSAARSFRAMSDAFKKEFGRPLMLSGGPGSDDAYRSYAAQKRLKDQKPYLAAPVGTSNHGWGLAVDLGGGVNLLGTPEHNWMVKHASRFGWGQEEFAKPGGSKPEEWHWTLFKVVKNLPETHEQNNHKHNQSKNKHDHNQSHKENHPGSKFPISKHGFTTPLDPKFHVTTPYDGYQNISGVHTGADYAAPIGTPARATNDGVVVKVWHNDSVVGTSVSIYHPNANMTSNYQHMDSTKLHEGQHVNLGEYIGRTGNKGNSSGPHLHYMLMHGRQAGVTAHNEPAAQVFAETDPPGDYLPTQHDIDQFNYRKNHPKQQSKPHHDNHKKHEPKHRKPQHHSSQPVEIRDEDVISVLNESSSQSLDDPEEPVSGPVASDRPTENAGNQEQRTSAAYRDSSSLDDEEVQAVVDSILAESN